LVGLRAANFALRFCTGQFSKLTHEADSLMSFYFKRLAIGRAEALRISAKSSCPKFSLGDTPTRVKSLTLFQSLRQLKSETENVYLNNKLAMLGF
jgi:hypothetical protein